jgi:hypothetical protein
MSVLAGFTAVLLSPHTKKGKKPPRGSDLYQTRKQAKKQQDLDKKKAEYRDIMADVRGKSYALGGGIKGEKTIQEIWAEKKAAKNGDA